MAGPVLFFFLMGTFLLLSGRVHFGYIYGLALFGSISLHVILSLMAPSSSTGSAVPSGAVPGASHPQAGGYSSYPGPSAQTSISSSSMSAADHDHNTGPSTLTFARSASVLGYCLLPLVMTSLVGIVMPMDTPLGIVLTSLAILWSTYSASGIFCTVSRMRSMRALVAYPLALFYVGFGIMSVFSSKGSGSLAQVKVASAL